MTSFKSLLKNLDLPVINKSLKDKSITVSDLLEINKLINFPEIAAAYNQKLDPLALIAIHYLRKMNSERCRSAIREFSITMDKLETPAEPKSEPEIKVGQQYFTQTMDGSLYRK